MGPKWKFYLFCNHDSGQSFGDRITKFCTKILLAKIPLTVFKFWVAVIEWTTLFRKVHRSKNVLLPFSYWDHFAFI